MSLLRFVSSLLRRYSILLMKTAITSTNSREAHPGRMKNVGSVNAFSSIRLFSAGPAAAFSSQPFSYPARWPHRLRRNRLQSGPCEFGHARVISGGADGTYIRIAADLANVLDGEDLRVLPMIGRGSLQNLRDIMFLRGVDIGIVQMDAREQLSAENLQDDAVRRLRFITASTTRRSTSSPAGTSRTSGSSTARRSTSTRPAAART